MLKDLYEIGEIPALGCYPAWGPNAVRRGMVMNSRALAGSLHGAD
jgi:hypothetical protein